jgi:hypothetical protein
MYDQHSIHNLNSSTAPQGYHVEDNQFYANQQRMLSEYGLHERGVDSQMLALNRRNFQQQRANLPPSRVRGSTRSYSRYDSYRDEYSEDDDFIDNRELDELTDPGYACLYIWLFVFLRFFFYLFLSVLSFVLIFREDDTLSDDADSIRDTRKRKRVLDFGERERDEPVEIIEGLGTPDVFVCCVICLFVFVLFVVFVCFDAHALDGGHVTRSRASAVGTVRKSYSRGDLQDSDEDSDDDDVGTHDTHEEDDTSGHDEDHMLGDDTTGGGDRDKEGKRVSKLEQLMAVCEKKVEKLTEILAANGLEYEVRVC